MKRTGALIISLVLLSCAAASADQNSLLTEKPELLAKAEQYPLLKAELLKKHELYAEAEKIITKAIEDDVREFRGEAAEMDRKVGTGEYSLSLSYLYSSRANCWHNLESFDKALEDYTESFRLNPNPDRLYDIGYCLYRIGRYEAAIVKFDEYLQKADYGKERNFLALYNRAFCILRTGKLDEGLNDLTNLQKNFPEWSKSVQYAIDQVLAEKKKRESANQKEASLVTQ